MNKNLKITNNKINHIGKIKYLFQNEIIIQIKKQTTFEIRDKINVQIYVHEMILPEIVGILIESS